MLARPARLSTAADWWYAALYLHDAVEDVLLRVVAPPAWWDDLGLWLCARYDAGMTR